MKEDIRITYFGDIKFTATVQKKKNKYTSIFSPFFNVEHSGPVLSVALQSTSLHNRSDYVLSASAAFPCSGK